MSGARGLRLRLALALALALGLAACSREPRGGGGSAPVDTALVAYLSEARALHHTADLAETSGDLGAAVEAMDRLTKAAWPVVGGGRGTAPEIDEVLADAHARLAQLELRRHRLAEAEAAVEAGLAHAPGETYFRGHLLEVQGLVLEAKAEALVEAGKAAEAAEVRQRAIALLQEVVRVQDAVVRRSLLDAGAAPAPR